jgi:D-alanyl-D-alanine dipeptidase
MVAKEITYNGRSILYLSDGTEFMGTHFDFFDEASHLDTALIGEEASANRKILRKVMSQNGFLEYDKEWWHYEFENESHPDTYFDFDII